LKKGRTRCLDYKAVGGEGTGEGKRGAGGLYVPNGFNGMVQETPQEGGEKSKTTKQGSMRGKKRGGPLRAQKKTKHAGRRGGQMQGNHTKLRNKNGGEKNKKKWSKTANRNAGEKRRPNRVLTDRRQGRG